MMASVQTWFDELQATAAREGAAGLFARLVERLRGEKKYHDLFDARLMQARHELGLSVIQTTNLDDLAEPLRTRMEDAYLAACREVGELLLAERRLREAWMYLRPVGAKEQVAAVLREWPPDAEDYEQVIEVALYEGVCPRVGFQRVLAHFGTCNAISLFDQQMHARPLAERQSVAGLLVDHLHGELLRNVRADAARREGAEPAEATLAEIVTPRPWLFENDNYHVDTTHLAAVVRFALSCEEPSVLGQALDLTEYGRRLASPYQFAGQEPFVDTYPAHARFFQVLLGIDVEGGLAYFRARAAEAPDSAAGEVLVGLLSRLGRFAEAFEAAAALPRPDLRSAGFAPSTLELAQRAGCYERLVEFCRQREDPLGFVAGLIDGAGTAGRAAKTGK